MNDCGHYMWVQCKCCKKTICAYCGKTQKQIDKEYEYEPIYLLFKETEQ